jgi:hypothetical protein
VFEAQNFPPAGSFSECASDHGRICAGVASRAGPIRGLNDTRPLAVRVVAGGPPIADPPLSRLLDFAEQATDFGPIGEELIRW